MLQDGLRRMKEAGKTVFIISSNPKNLTFYQKHGFHVHVKAKFRNADLFGLAQEPPDTEGEGL